MKNTIYIILLAIVFVGCGDFILDDKNPSITERQNPFYLLLKDKTGIMFANYGDSLVKNATVTFKSNKTGFSVVAKSNDKGIVELKNAISDLYLVTVRREISPEELQKAKGLNSSDYVLINKELSLANLRVDKKDTSVFKLDTKVESPIVISEIYVSGAAGTGSYYHDKYVELYNQTDSTLYLDGMMIALSFFNTSVNYVNDSKYVHTKTLIEFPGTGKQYPIKPGQFVVVAEDGMDHTKNAPLSVDLSNADFEVYKEDSGQDLDFVNVPNMIIAKYFQGYDWVPHGEKGGIILVKAGSKLVTSGDETLIPTEDVIDGVEYLKDPSRLDLKGVNPSVDASGTGGALFYSGKAMEREWEDDTHKRLKDNNNSAVDFRVIDRPTPKSHF